MKDRRVHRNDNYNLMSIKPIENIYSDREYLASIIKKLFALTNGSFYLEVSRPNYETSKLVTQLKTISNVNCSFKSSDFEISFSSANSDINLLEFLPMIWFAYEHVSFCFFIANEIEFDTKRKSWQEITSRFKSYMLFKGAEEDVIWIGKSNDLKFDLDYPLARVFRRITRVYKFTRSVTGISNPEADVNYKSLSTGGKHSFTNTARSLYLLPGVDFI